jgi:PhnB protein
MSPKSKNKKRTTAVRRAAPAKPKPVSGASGYHSVMQPETRSGVHLYVPDCDAAYARAIAAGATPKMPLQDMFWGDRFGSVQDPFGNTWSIATHKEDVSPAEMQRRMAALPPMGGPRPATA